MIVDLERSLAELADRVEIPGGDWMVSDVMRRIGEPARPPARRRVVRLAGALVAVVAVTVVVLPGPRRAVARWLGFDSVRIEPGVTLPTTTVVTTAPAASPTTVVTTVPLPSTATAAATTTEARPDLDLGPSVSLDEAIAETGLPDPAPALLGDPQSIHVVHPPADGQIMMVYPPSDLAPQSAVTGVGALVSVWSATIDEGFFRKMLGDDATVQFVDVEGADAFWIEGSPHQMFFQVGDEIEIDTLRLATNTLLWERDGHVYRLEADIDVETALRIAASVP